MRSLIGRTKLIAVLAITIVLVVIGVLNLRDRLSSPPIPDDGVEWVDGKDGVQARSVRSDSPLALTIKKGDYVRFIFYNDKYEEVPRSETLSFYLDRIGVGRDARYVIEHHDPALATIFGIDQPFYDVDFKVTSLPQRLGQGLYLAFVGLVYLAIGLFVLFKQGRAALTYHFFSWSLISYVAYFYSAPFIGTPLDKLVSLLDNSALALLAPLFLHFCLSFRSVRGKPLHRPLALAMYAPAALLVILEVLYEYKPRTFPGGGLVQVRQLLNVAGNVQLLFFFVLAGVLLAWTFVRSDKPLVKQQLKWIIWGLGLSVPFVALNLIPHVSPIEIPAAL
jgi:two-component system, NtrC family, sensor kinase